MKILPLYLSVFFLVFSKSYAQPSITSFSPTFGKVGSTITISGSGFSTTPTDNIVFLGNLRATVSSASSSSLTVTVPLRCFYSNFVVNVSNLQTVSDKEFNITFGDGESISSSSFSSGTGYSVDNNPRSIEIADIDGDGKPDIGMSIHTSVGEMSFFRNTSTLGSISLATKVDVATSDLCDDLALADIDGDGKIDAIATVNNSSSNNLQIFRNLSTSGTISFSSATNFTRSGHIPFNIATGDLNLDGKLDIVHSNFSTSSISIAENTSTSGSISLATHFNLSVGSNPAIVLLEDIDGDGKRDILCANYSSNTISIYRNIHSSGSLSASSFSSVTPISTGSGTNPQHLAMADIDGDGKRDLVTNHQSGGNLVIYRNTSTSGSISFASGVSYSSGNTPRSAFVADINGDGKPDVVTSNIGSNTFRVYQNNSTSGTISLSSGTTFSTNSQPYYSYPVDLDGDTKPDIVTANSASNNIQVFRNTQLATEPSTASSFMSFSSLTANSMTVSWANGNGARRIVALKASGTPPSVTSPVDATEYTANASFGSGADLGSGWYVVYDGTGSSVSVTNLTLNQQYYCVIFEYNGRDATINYQTSYASGTQLLPVEFLSFTATGSEKGVQLNWSTAWEINNSHFEIERSTQGINEFTYLGEHRGKGNSLAISEYSYLDNEIAKHAGPTFYRLKQVDLNGTYKYSNVAVASLIEEKMNFVGPEAFPTVVYKELYVKLGSIENKLISVSVVDSRGQPVRQSFDNFDIINCLTWDAGIYYVLIDYLDAYGTLKRQATKISKQ